MCISPVVCYRSKSVNPGTGRRGITHDLRKAYDGAPIYRPCGQCVECRIQDASDKTVRMVHESRSHEVNSYVTLTYAKEPENGSLDHRHFQLFMKRLRELSAFKFKFYMCGEYGDMKDRPHYHAMLFGCDFNDKVKYKKNANGDWLYTSKLLEDTWQLGFCTIGDVTQQSCRYVAGYVTKKITGAVAPDYYGDRLPEYGRGSNGLGLEYLRQFGHQWMTTGFIVIDGSKYRIPRYYDIKFRELDALAHDVVKDKRILNARDRPVDENKDCRTFNRYQAVDISKRAKLKSRSRDYEA